jgi:hypothetical protein
MKEYYVNTEAQHTGEHEVHEKGCSYFPRNAKYLEIFSDCHGAVKKAREYYNKVDGCFYCCRDCHTR